MKRLQLPLAAVATAVLAFTACGSDDGGDEPDTTSAVTSPSDATTGGDESTSDSDIPEEIREMFPNLTDEQVDCLREAGEDLNVDNIGDAMDVLERCDLDLSDMQIPDLSDVSLPTDLTVPELSELVDELTPDEISCLQEEAGGVTPTDLDEAREILDRCGVDPAVLGG